MLHVDTLRLRICDQVARVLLADDEVKLARFLATVLESLLRPRRHEYHARWFYIFRGNAWAIDG